ncbi:MAG: CDF family Co(II)/Ni(II) efflux transporter DmeF [Deltaproteobacteria bacterium]|nr:CDF family Co(II)/Ni(II) efflux transporter DmeF [Deltaproteobacteria bacterium]
MHDEVATQSCAVHETVTFARHERQARVVMVLTAVVMVLELIVGTWTQSLALVADGWHMATHVGALGLTAFAYWFARTRAGTKQFAFGVGKIHALAGYTNALILALIALHMMLESVYRLLTPVSVAFLEALPIAVLGLAVNLVCAWLLDVESLQQGDAPHAHDLNLRSAYMHVLADALTSILAIGALLGGYYAGWTFLDPLSAFVGGVMILVWSIGLCRESARELLNVVSSTELVRTIQQRVEALGDARVADLHVWELGQGRIGCIVSVHASTPRPVAEYREAILAVAPIDHLTVEVEPCLTHQADPAHRLRQQSSQA